MGDKEKIARLMFQLVTLTDDKEIEQRWKRLQPSVRRQWCGKAETLTELYEQLGYRKPGELLTPEEGEAAVNKWVQEDWATRYISINRGHWEQLIPVIAQAQLDKGGG